jgi:hypothetical protein
MLYIQLPSGRGHPIANFRILHALSYLNEVCAFLFLFFIYRHCGTCIYMSIYLFLCVVFVNPYLSLMRSWPPYRQFTLHGSLNHIHLKSIIKRKKNITTLWEHFQMPTGKSY